MRDGVFHKRIAAAYGASVFALAGLPLAATAQTSPPPVQVPPGTQTAPTQQQINPQLQNPVKPHKRVDSHDMADFAPCPLDNSTLTANITSVNFSGPGGAQLPEKIQKVLARVGPVSQGDAPISQVCRIRDRANSALRQNGYIASVQIVPQDLSSGALQLTVVTAHFTDIRVHGDPGPYRELMDERIKQLMALDPLNELDAERILLLTGDVPGLDVRLSLRSAGTTPGAVIGDLTVATTTYRVQANVNNYGSEELGRESAYARLEMYGLTGHADMTYVGVSSTWDGREQQVAQIGHVMALGKHGDTIGASFVFARSRPDLGALDLRTESKVANFEYYHPLIRTVSKDLLLYGGMDVVEQKTQVFGGSKTTTLNLDKLSIAYLRLNGALHWPGLPGGEGISVRASVEARKGLDAFGASKICPSTPTAGVSCILSSGLRTDPQASVERFNADAVAGLGPIFTVAGTLRSQHSSKVLANYEKFAIGNLTIGRGYDPGAVTADSAIGWRAEVRALFARSQPMKGEAFAFYDAVKVWSNEPVQCGPAPAICANSGNGRTLASYGAGVRFILPGKWIGEITVAKPLDIPLPSVQKEPPPARIMFSLTTQFPTSY